MAKPKNVKRSRRTYSKTGRRGMGRKKPVFHVVPDLLAAGGVLDVLAEANTFPLLKEKNYATAGNYLVDTLTNWEYLKAPLTLEVGAVAVKWAAKKFHLNNIGTKEFKLF